MRVLLIDNHDSFTYNLAHDLAVLTGQMPVVCRNDEPLPGSLDAFDAVVVSPGPGTPERAEDLGISADVVAQGVVPVLGVCLGMQTIAHRYGGRIRPAPRPVHGEVALVEHAGGGVFDGQPTPLPMVRYHSLVVDDLPEELVIDAWCDGLVMGLHHRDRPVWGVQTHPESISSVGGRQLLATFLRLAGDWNARHRGARRQATPPVAPAPTPEAVGDPRTVLLRRVPFTGSPEVVFDTFFRGQAHAWWLDSAGRDVGAAASASSLSACGSADGPLARVCTEPLPELLVRVALDVRRPLRLLDLDDVAGEPPFWPGWVGHLGYEDAAAHLLGEPRRPGDSVLVFTDRVVALDGATAFVLALTDDEVDTAQRAWVDETAAGIGGLTAPPPAPPTGALDVEVHLRHDRAAYLRLIDRCTDLIAAGESYELCLTNRLTITGDVDPDDLYRRLRATSPRPFGAFLSFSDTHLLSASPERFLRVRGRVVEAKPIKGTRPRGLTPDEDAALARELREDVKERAENLMIVDLLRHDLSRVCVPGSVDVPVLFDVESHAGVHQLVSTVTGELAPGRDALDALAAALPGGSMTGAPKERSVQLLAELEGGERGLYSGVVGYVSVTGDADFSIVIRAVVHRPGEMTYGIGGAITARSDPAAEWAEIMVKARTLGAALGIDLDPVFAP
ncbi:MAG: aminodeoxychorismate synthase component I [Mobilicoccus sp.]|nr:aminodeoxychorismate synthase component I [Mobilicoccus sp.]